MQLKLLQAPLGGGGGSGRSFSRLGASVWYLALLMMLLPPFSVSLLTLGTLCRAPGFVLIFSNSKRKQLVLCFHLSPRMLLRSGIRDGFCPAQRSQRLWWVLLQDSCLRSSPRGGMCQMSDQEPGWAVGCSRRAGRGAGEEGWEQFGNSSPALAVCHSTKVQKVKK